MYRPQANPSTNAAPVSPTPTPTPPAPGVVRVLAPEGHFPAWLVETLKPQVEVQVTTYSKILEAKPRLETGSFEIYLLPDRLIREGISQNRFQEFPKEFLAEISKPNAMYLHHPFDLQNQFSIPYACTFYAIATHKDAIPKPITKWSELLSSANSAQCELPDDVDLLTVLESLALNQIGKSNHPPVAKAQAITASTEEQPIRVQTISSLKKLQLLSPAWQISLPPEGSVIKLDHLLLGSTAPLTLTVAREFLRPLNAARLADENLYASPVKGIRSQQQHAKDPLLYPPESWLDKAIFVKPTARALPATVP